MVLAFRGDLAPGGRAANVRVAGCKFVDPDPAGHVGIEESHGIVLNQLDRTLLERLEFVDIGDESVDIIRSTDVRVLDCHVRGGSAAITIAHAGSISVNSSSRVQLRGNVIERQANGSAIRVEVHTEGTQADYVLIANNQIFDAQDRAGLGLTSGSGITVIPAVNRATTVTITGNQIVNPYRYGIYVKPLPGAVTSAIVIQGNSVVGGGRGIATEASPHHGAIAVLGDSTVGSVVGNVVQDWGSPQASHAGIRLLGRRLAVVANAIAGVAGPAIREASPAVSENVILGNVIPQQAESGSPPY
jgi:hypothetical protein